LSMVCDKAGVNVWDVIEFANKHPRVNILQPGPGVGGHCIAVDPWFIVSDFEKEAQIIRKAREVNLYKTDWVVEKIEEKISDFKKAAGKEPVVACMGLAFKPNIDDLRESPALEVTKKLIAGGAQIIVSEPNIDELEEMPLHNEKEAVGKSDIVAFLVAHNEYKELKIDENKILLDFCGVQNGK
jgi:UDP-N-acetyl-D-mannosaminuronic acid dehydrogenase